MKLKPVADDAGRVQGYAFFCPGCQHAHVFYVAGNITWTFNGDRQSPTFMPSLLNTCDGHVDPKQRRCHLNLVAGKLNYGTDCTHDLAGKVVDLPDYWPVL